MRNLLSQMHCRPVMTCQKMSRQVKHKERPRPIESDDAYLSLLFHQLSRLLEHRNGAMLNTNLSAIHSPQNVPTFWISKWVDCSDKYGIGYQLSDNSVGVLFNDNSRILTDQSGHEVAYIERGRELAFPDSAVPRVLAKKVTLLKYFRSYMNDNLLDASGGACRRDGDGLARLPTLRVWVRTKSAILLQLSNGTVQINFFNDHVKMILCPLLQSVTLIDEHQQMQTYKFSDLLRSKCPEKFLLRLKYAKVMIERLVKEASR